MPTVDPAARLLSPRSGDGRRSRRRLSLQGLSMFLRQAGSRRMMREPSMMVREAAADQLEERQSDWAYSRPVVFLDVLWNLAFVGVAAGVLVFSRQEAPSMPLRLWIAGYALQCVLHVVCVSVEYWRRHSTDGIALDLEEGESRTSRSPRLSSLRGAEEGAWYGERSQDEDNSRIFVHLKCHPFSVRRKRREYYELIYWS